MSTLKTDNIESLDTGRVIEVDSLSDRQDLASDASGSGAALVSMEGGPSVEVAVLGRVIRVTLVSQLPATSTEGFQALVSGVPYIYKSSAWVPSEGYVTPDGYGAVGDGTTNDRTALQSALNTGYTVFIPGKTYSFDSTINYTKNGQAIVGAGWGSVLKQGTGTAYINSLGFNDIQLKDLSVDGAGGGFFTIRDGSAVVLVKGVKFTGGGQRVWLWTCSEVTVDGCYFEECGYQVIQQLGYVSDNGKVINCTSINCLNDFVELNCEVNHPSKNWLVANNTVKNVGATDNATESRFVGVTMVDGLIIANNTVDGIAGDSAIHLERPGRVKIIGNTFRNCRGSSGGARFVYLLSNTDVTIIGNDFIVDTDTPSNSSAFINNGAVLEQGRLVITGNNFFYYGSSFPSDPIAADRSGKGINVSFHYGKDVIIENNQFANLDVGVYVNETAQGGTAVSPAIHIQKNLFNRCNIPVQTTSTGFVQTIEHNTMQQCASPWDFGRQPVTLQNNRFMSMDVLDWMDIELNGNTSGNIYQDAPNNDPLISQGVAHNATTKLAKLPTSYDLLLYIFIERSSNSVNNSRQIWHISNRYGSFSASVISAQGAGSGLPAVTLTGTGTNDVDLNILLTGGTVDTHNVKIALSGSY